MPTEFKIAVLTKELNNVILSQKNLQKDALVAQS